VTQPPVRTPSVRLRDMKFPIVAFVPHGANMREFAQIEKEQAAMKLNPTCKAGLCKAYGAHAEKSVQMADMIAKADEDPNAPPHAPEEVANAHTAMMEELKGAIGPHMAPPAEPVEQAAAPAAAPPEAIAQAADPEVEMTAEMSATVEKADAFVAMSIKKLGAAITTKTAEKYAKGIEAGNAVRKAYTDFKSATPIAKGMGAKKLTFKQYVGFQNDIMARFTQLIMDFLPLLSEINENGAPSVSDLPAAQAPDVTEGMDPAAMAKQVGDVVAKQAGDAIAKSFGDLASKLEARIGHVEENVVAIAKARGSSNGNPAEDVRGARQPANEDTAVTPYVDLVERMRAEGKLT